MQPSQRVVTATASEMSWRVFSPSLLVLEVGSAQRLIAADRVWTSAC